MYTYTYDSRGNLETETDNKENTTHYEYDRLKRLRKITFADNAIEEYNYNEVGNRTRTAIGNKPPTITHYNSMGNIIRITDPCNYETGARVTYRTA